MGNVAIVTNTWEKLSDEQIDIQREQELQRHDGFFKTVFEHGAHMFRHYNTLELAIPSCSIYWGISHRCFKCSARWLLRKKTLEDAEAGSDYRHSLDERMRKLKNEIRPLKAKMAQELDKKEVSYQGTVNNLQDAVETSWRKVQHLEQQKGSLSRGLEEHDRQLLWILARSSLSNMPGTLAPVSVPLDSMPPLCLRCPSPCRLPCHLPSTLQLRPHRLPSNLLSFLKARQGLEYLRTFLVHRFLCR